jgi:membrane protein YdbS with pleckstrin-like domain
MKEISERPKRQRMAGLFLRLPVVAQTVQYFLSISPKISSMATAMVTFKCPAT